MADSPNIAAWTAPGSPYPPYISINDEGGGVVSVTVRCKAAANGGCGNAASIKIPQDSWRELVRAIIKPAETAWQELATSERAAALRGFEEAINYVESISGGTGSAILSRKMRAELARRRSNGER